MEKKNSGFIKFIVTAALIAAVYAVVTIALMPFSYGPVQVRISEALTVLPAVTPAAVPGLFFGCLVSNFMSPVGILDVVFGSLATLLAAIVTFSFRKFDIIAPLPPVIFNAIIIGTMLHILYTPSVSLFSCMLWVGLGEFISCYVLGLPLLKVLRKHGGIFATKKD